MSARKSVKPLKKRGSKRNSQMCVYLLHQNLNLIMFPLISPPPPDTKRPKQTIKNGL